MDVIPSPSGVRNLIFLSLLEDAADLVSEDLRTHLRERVAAPAVLEVHNEA